MVNKFIEQTYDILVVYTQNIMNGNGYRNTDMTNDFLNDVFLEMITKDKFIKKDNYEDFYIRNIKLIKYIISIQINSSTSPFYRKYISPRPGLYWTTRYDDFGIDVIDENDKHEHEMIDKKINLVEKILSDKKLFSFYGEIKLFRLYYEEKFTYHEICDLTGIGYNTVFKIIKGVRNKVISEINNITNI